MQTEKDIWTSAFEIGQTVYHVAPYGVLKNHVVEIKVNGYSESKWQGKNNIGRDYRFIICHNSYNQPIAYEFKHCYATKEEANRASENYIH